MRAALAVLCASSRVLIPKWNTSTTPNAYLLAKFSFDTAENEPCQVSPTERSLAYRTFQLRLTQPPAQAAQLGRQGAQYLPPTGDPQGFRGIAAQFPGDQQGIVSY